MDDRVGIAKQRRNDAITRLLSTPEGQQYAKIAPKDRMESMLYEIEGQLQQENPDQYSTQYTRELGRGARKNTVTESVPVLDYESETALNAISEWGEEDIDELSSAELLSLRQALPIEELYPEKDKLFAEIGARRTGVSDMGNRLLAVGRGAIPFGGDLMDLTEEEVASLMLQNPGFKSTEVISAIAGLFAGSGAGFKAISKLKNVGKTGKIGLNVLKEGALGGAYAATAPGMLAEVMDKPDSHVINFMEAAAIAGTIDAGASVIKMLRGKKLQDAGEIIKRLSDEGEIPVELVDRLPDRLRLPGDERKLLATDQAAGKQLRLTEDRVTGEAIPITEDGFSHWTNAIEGMTDQQRKEFQEYTSWWKDATEATAGEAHNATNFAKYKQGLTKIAEGQDPIEVATKEIEELSGPGQEYTKWWEDNVGVAGDAQSATDYARYKDDLKSSTQSMGLVASASKLQAINAVAGGMGGYAMGETPEERLEYALYGSVLGATGTAPHPYQLGLLKNAGPDVWKRARSIVSIHASDKADNIRKWINTNLPTHKGMGKDLYKIKESFDNTKNRNSYLIGKDVENAQRKLKKEFGGKIPKPVLNQLNGILHGKDVPDAPQSVYEVASELREKLTKSSMKLKPLLSEELQATFDANANTYVHRSYEVFDNPKWKLKVKTTPKLRQAYSAAFDHLKKEYPGESDDFLHNLLENHVDPNKHPGDPLEKLMGLGMGRGILKRRNDKLDKSLRKVMGEYEDPFVNYTKSMLKIDNLMQNKRMVQDMVDKGEGTLLFGSLRNAPRGFNTKVGGDFDRIRNMYTTPEMAKALNTMGNLAPINSELYSTFLQLKSASQISKTIFSPSAHLRNFMGSTIMAAANGNLSRGGAAIIGGNIGGAAAGTAAIDEDDEWYDMVAKIGVGTALGTVTGAGIAKLSDKRFSDSLRVVTGDLLNTGNKNLQRKYAEYLDKGIVESSVTFQEMKKVLQDAGASRKTMMERFSETPGVKQTFDAYRGQDDIWKIYSYESELAKLRKAKKGKWSNAQIEEYAGDIVRNNLPNYGRTGKLVQRIRRWPVGNFVSFPAEVIRNSGNIVRTSLKEMQDPDLRFIGAQRLASFGLIGLGMIGGLAATSRHLTGVSREEDLRIGEDLPEWERNSDRLYLGSDNSKGYPVLKYVNLGYTDPYQYVKEPFITVWNEFQRGGDPDEVALGATIDGFKNLLNPFADASILSAASAEAFAGRTREGREIWSPTADSFDEKATKGILHIAEKAFTPTGLKDIQDITDPYKLPESEIAQLGTGLRVQTYDPKEALRWRTRSYSKAIQDIRPHFTRTTYRKDATKEDLIGNYVEANQKAFEQQRKLYRTAQNSLKAGLTQSDVMKILKDQGVPDRTRSRIIRGQFDPIKVSSGSYENIVKNGLTPPSQEFGEAYGVFIQKSLTQPWEAE